MQSKYFNNSGDPVASVQIEYLITANHLEAVTQKVIANKIGRGDKSRATMQEVRKCLRDNLWYDGFDCFEKDDFNECSWLPRGYTEAQVKYEAKVFCRKNYPSFYKS